MVGLTQIGGTQGTLDTAAAREIGLLHVDRSARQHEAHIVEGCDVLARGMSIGEETCARTRASPARSSEETGSPNRRTWRSCVIRATCCAAFTVRAPWAA